MRGWGRFGAWLVAAFLVLGIGVLVGRDSASSLGSGVMSLVGAIRSLTNDQVSTNEVLEFRKDQVGEAQPSTPQSLIGAFEGIYSIYEQVGGRRTNFQNVLTYPENSSIRRLSHGVARLDISIDGSDKARACTAFLISDVYALTAGHCFAAERTCSGAKTAQLAKLKAMEVKIANGKKIEGSAFLVFRYFGNEQGGLASDDVIDPIPVTPVKGEVRCEEGLDYAIVELPKGAVDRARAEQKAEISPVFLGDVPIEPGHQLLILHHPDGRSLMATERHCLAADPPRREDRYFAHYCDTLAGSSGAPVFSRDHEVVAGIHLKSQIDPRTAGEENAAILIAKLVENSKLLRGLNILAKDPLTAEQQKLVDYANQRGEQAQSLNSEGRHALATMLATDGLSPIFRRSEATDRPLLLRKTGKVQFQLSDAISQDFVVASYPSAKDLDAEVAVSRDGIKVFIGGATPAGLWLLDRKPKFLQFQKRTENTVSAAMSGNGKIVVTAAKIPATRTFSVGMFSTQTGQEIGSASFTSASDVSVHVNDRGNLVFVSEIPPDVYGPTFDAVHNAMLWNVDTGSKVSIPNAFAFAKVFTADGSHFLTTRRERDAEQKYTEKVSTQLRSVAGGKIIAQWGRVFAANRQLSRLVSDDAELIDTKTGTPIAKLEACDLRDRFSFVGERQKFNETGSRLVCVSHDDRPIVIDARTGSSTQLPRDPEVGGRFPRAYVESTFISRDGSRVLLVVGSYEERLSKSRHVGLWDVASRRLVSSFTQTFDGDQYWSNGGVGFEDLDARWVVDADLQFLGVPSGANESLPPFVIDVGQGGRRVQISHHRSTSLFKFILSTHYVGALAFEDGNDTVLSGGQDGFVRRTYLRKPLTQASYKVCEDGEVRAIRSAQVGKYFLVACASLDGGSTHLLSSEAISGTRVTKLSGGPAVSIAPSSDGRFLFAAQQGGAIRAFDIDTNRELPGIRVPANSNMQERETDKSGSQKKEEEGIPTLIARPGSKRVYVLGRWKNGGAESIAVRSWIFPGWQDPQTLTSNDGALLGAMSSDGETLATAPMGEDGSVSVWNLSSNKLSQRISLSGRITALAINDRGSLVAIGSSRGVQLFSTASGQELSVPCLPRDKMLFITALQFGRRANWLAVTRAWSGGLEVYDLDTCKTLAARIIHDSAIGSMDLSDDGKWLVTGSSDQTIRIVNTDAWKEVAVLRDNEGAVNSVKLDVANDWIFAAAADGIIVSHPTLFLHPDKLIATATDRIKQLKFSPVTCDRYDLASCTVALEP